MLFQKVLPALLLILPALARESSFLSRRQSCVESCGNTCYYQSDLDNAVNAGHQEYQSGETEGYDAYPHTYNNDEGFDFPVSGPYQEFPILSDYQTYSGGSPGPDRVIFNTQGEFAGVITHTGASGNGFVACSGQYVKKE